MLCPFCDSVDSHVRKDYEQTVLTICPNCNGEVQVKEHTSATQCPYCDNYLIFNERVEGEYTPKLIIPFKLGKEKCKEVLFCSHGFFVRGSFEQYAGNLCALLVL